MYCDQTSLNHFMQILENYFFQVSENLGILQ